MSGTPLGGAALVLRRSREAIQTRGFLDAAQTRAAILGKASDKGGDSEKDARPLLGVVHLVIAANLLEHAERSRHNLLLRAVEGVGDLLGLGIDHAATLLEA